MEFSKFVFLLIFCLPNLKTENECPEVNATKPQFSRKMKDFILMIDGHTAKIECCMFGIKSLNWSFRSIKDGAKWIPKINRRETSYKIRIPRKFQDEGIYKCTGYSHSGDSLEGSSIVDVVFSRKTVSGKVINSSYPSQIVYQKSSNVSLFCTISDHKANNPFYIWQYETSDKKRNITLNQSLNSSVRYINLSEGYTGFTSLEIRNYSLWTYAYTFSIAMQKLKEEHEGSYCCIVKDEYDLNEYDLAKKCFRLVMQRRDVLPIVLLFSVLGIIIIISTMIYLLRYDFKVLGKGFLRLWIFKGKMEGKYAFSILYDLDNENELIFIYTVVQSLESNRFPCYFHHRDQTYGKDALEDVYDSCKNSDAVIFWISENFFKNSICIICSEKLIERSYEKPRAYILTTDKAIMEQCNIKILKADMKYYLSNKVYYLNRASLSKKSDDNIIAQWKRHSFIMWLISFLPIL